MEIQNRIYSSYLPNELYPLQNLEATQSLYSKLEITNKDYQRYIDTWNSILKFYSVSNALKSKREILLPSLGEPPQIYDRRLENFVFTPVFFNCVRDTIKKLQYSPVLSNNETADNLIKSLDGYKFSFNQLSGTIVKSWLLFSRCVLLFDGQNILNIDPRALINYGGEDELFWVVSVNREINKLFEPTKVIKSWFVIKEISREDNIYSMTQYDSEDGKEPIITLNMVYNFCPIIVLDCTEDLWVGSRVWTIQKSHVLVDNWALFAASNLYIQKTLKPTPSDANTLIEEEGQYSSNASFIVGDMSFIEASGTSVTSLWNYLDRLADRISDTVSMRVIEYAPDASGASKEYDKNDENSTLMKIGEMVKSALPLVCQKFLNLEGIEFTGHTDYSLDFDSYLAKTELLAGIEKLPDSVWSLWIKKIERYIVG